MPLVEATLKSAIEAIGPQATIASAAAAWASAIGSYASSILPASGTVAAAQTTLQTALAAAFATTAAAGPMEAAMFAFATTVAGGMAGFTPTTIPVLGGIGFASLFATPRSTAAAAAEAIATAIHDWMTTGKSTLSVPPATLTPWS
jgi:hypothetical protein